MGLSTSGLLQYSHASHGEMRKTRTGDRKSTRLNSSHLVISYAVFCLKKKKTTSSILVHYHIWDNANAICLRIVSIHLRAASDDAVPVSILDPHALLLSDVITSRHMLQ